MTELPERLSPHFTLKEMTVTKSGLPNIPGPKEVAALTALASNVLEKVRERFGPVIVTSGFRSELVNKSVGGALNSQHRFGEAADFHCPRASNADVWRWITDPANGIVFDQCIAERLRRDNGQAGWIHVSFRTGRNRKEGLSSPKVGQYLKGLHFAA